MKRWKSVSHYHPIYNRFSHPLKIVRRYYSSFLVVHIEPLNTTQDGIFDPNEKGLFLPFIFKIRKSYCVFSPKRRAESNLENKMPFKIGLQIQYVESSSLIVPV